MSSQIGNDFAEIADRRYREQRLRDESEESHGIGSRHKNENLRQHKTKDGAKGFPPK